MIERFFKHSYHSLCIAPTVAALVKRKISPNFITSLALLSGLAVAGLLYLKMPPIALFFLIISGYCDTIDGPLARALQKESPKGSVFDIVADRIVEFAVILGLFLLDPPTRGTYSLLMLGSVLICVTSFLVVSIFLENDSHKSFHYSPGIMERPEAFLFFTLMILFPHSFEILALTFTVLLLLTAAIRVIEFSKSFT